LPWFARGLALVLAADAGVIGREGPEQPLGMSNIAAAGRAFLRAMSLDTGFVAAAEALAQLPRPREGVPEMQRWVAGLAGLEDQLAPASRFAVARMQREVGDLVAAQAWIHAASSEIAPGLVALEQTRLHYLRGEAAAGWEAYLTGGSDPSPETGPAYRAHLTLVASPEELAAFDAVAPGDRSAWLRQFWTLRDVMAGWPVGTRLQEHFRRVETAWSRYRVATPQTGRHAVGSVSRHVDFLAEELLQRYYADNFTTTIVDAETGRVQEAYADYVRLAGDRQAIGTPGLLRAFAGTAETLDDRGLMYIRHGEPDRVARTTGGESLELWRYERSGEPLLLSFREQDFDGQVGASTIVASLLWADPLLRAQVCHLDTRLCPLDNDPRSQDLRMREGGMSPGSWNRGRSEVVRLGSGTALAAARAEGEAAIADASASDTHGRRFASALETRAFFLGLLESNGRPVLVVPFAIPGDRLVGEPIGPGPRTGYRVRFLLRAVNRSGQVSTIDTTRGFATPRPLAGGEYLTGLLEMPLPPGQYDASLVTTHSEDRGAIAGIERGNLPQPAVFGIGAIVLGRDASALAWHGAGEPVALNPLGGFRTGEVGKLFYQVIGVPADDSLVTRVEVWRGRPDEARPQISVRFTDRSSGMIHPVRRDLGLDRLEAGTYQLRLRVTAGERTVSGETWFTVQR
jgi:hypothetical protein